MTLVTSSGAVSLRLDGKVALVTGASSGLGRHFAALLAAHGAAVAVAARRIDSCRAVARAITDAGGTAIPIEIDVTDRDAVDAAVKEIADRLGIVDVLVNNAGIANTSPLLETGRDVWDSVLDTNLTGSFQVATAVAGRLKMAGRGGAIVNVSSILGVRVAGNVGAYAASKAGLIQLTRTMALEWARYGIRANSLCPGYVETELNRDFFATDAGEALIRRVPSRRLGNVTDLDGPLLLLCSDAGAAMTGSLLAVDGGHLVSSL